MAELKKVFCTNCSSVIYRSTSHINENIKLGHNFYCSKKCLSEYRTKKQLMVCENNLCNKQFLRKSSDISPHNYCSKSCAAIINNKRYPKKHPKPRYMVCVECEKRFRKSTGNIKYCSIKCRRETEWHTPEELLQSIRNITQKLGRVPARREAEGIGDSCRKFFGSWNNAIIAAGFQPNRSHSQRMYKRVETKARDGHICDSASESIVDDWLTKNGIIHEKDVSYPQTNHRADWAIKNGKVFIEYFGLANDSPRYDRAAQKKIQLCQKHKIKLIAIYPSDLYPKVHLDSKLKNKIGAL